MKDITTNLFRIRTSGQVPAVGCLLIAEPFLDEDYFTRAVVSVIDYIPEEGATGVVMNNRTDYHLHEMLDGIDPATEIPVYCGGPLGQDRLYFIHTLGPEIIPGAREYAPGLYIGGNFSAVADYVNAGYRVDGCVRFFVGYSNWIEGQLERELTDNSWVVAPMPDGAETLLTGAADAYWHRAVASLGETYRPWRLMPRNASAN
ncbi:MAG: YqgE/AlgH family protein [Muribaculaceae bacterium]|nr:YqgE/AlgH family protein [Muribaculaceae bacterium]